MNKKIVIDGDDGWFEAVVRTAEGEFPVRLDALKASNMFSVFTREHEDEAARAEAWLDWLAGEGVPRLTHGGAFRLATAIIDHVNGFFARHFPAPQPTAAPAPVTLEVPAEEIPEGIPIEGDEFPAAG